MKAAHYFKNEAAANLRVLYGLHELLKTVVYSRCCPPISNAAAAGWCAGVCEHVLFFCLSVSIHLVLTFSHAQYTQCGERHEKMINVAL